MNDIKFLTIHPVKLTLEKSIQVKFTFINFWDEHFSNFWNGSIIGQIESVIENLWANNSTSMCNQVEASEAWLVTIGVELWQEFLLVDNNFALDIFAFQRRNLTLHELLVLLNSLISHRLQDFDIRLSASQNNLAFHKFDQSLNE